MITHEQLKAWHDEWVSTDDNSSFGEYIAKRAYEQGKRDAIPEGWQLVPKEISPSMIKNAQVNSEIGAFISSNWSGAYDCFAEFYKTMLAAAPEVKP